MRKFLLATMLMVTTSFAYAMPDIGGPTPKGNTMSLEQADYGMTEGAMLGQNARYQGDERLLVQFHMHPQQDAMKSAKEGRPIFVDKEYVRMMVPGNRDSEVDRPVRITDPQRFPKHYAAFKAGESEVLEGTPLTACPWISKSQVEELKHFHIRTIEQLADVSDVNVQKFMGVAVLRQQARAFVANAKSGSGTTELVAQMKEKDNQIETLRQAMADLSNKLSALTPAPPAKPRSRAKTA